MFSEAMDQLDEIWNKASYGSQNVASKSKKPNTPEQPYADYEEVKNLFVKGRSSEKYEEYKQELKFFLKHVYRRSYFLHFRKCFDDSCTHCHKNIKYPEAFHILEKYTGKSFTLPKPVLIKELYNEKHYPSLIDIDQSPDLLKKVQNQIQKEEKASDAPEKCCRCNWYFQSANDKKEASVVLYLSRQQNLWHRIFLSFLC